MVKRTVTKSLIVMEDIAQGKGQISQTRAGLPIDVHKVDVYYAVDSEAEMTALDITEYSRASVYSSETTFINYIFDSAAVAGIAPDVGVGFWIVVNRDEKSAILRLNPATLAIWQNDPFARAKDTVITKERTAGKGGGAPGNVIEGTGTANGTDKVQHNFLPLTWVLRINALNNDIRQWGATGVGDDTTPFTDALGGTVPVVANDLVYTIDDIDVVTTSLSGNGTIKSINAAAATTLIIAANDLSFTGTDNRLELDGIEIRNANGFDGLIIDYINQHDTWLTGIVSYDTERLQVTRSIFDNIGISPTVDPAFQGAAVFTRRSNNLVIEDNEITRTFGHGAIFFNESNTNVSAQRNKISNTFWSAIHCFGSGAEEITGLIKDNECSDMGGINDGATGVGASAIFANNLLDTSGCDVIDNTIENVVENGIEGGFGKILRNTIDGTGVNPGSLPTPSTEGIFVNGGGQIVKGNVVSNTTKACIRAFNTNAIEGLDITDNNLDGGGLVDGVEINSSTSLANIDITINHFKSCVRAHHMVSNGDSTCNISGNTYTDCDKKFSTNFRWQGGYSIISSFSRLLNWAFSKWTATVLDDWTQSNVTVTETVENGKFNIANVDNDSATAGGVSQIIELGSSGESVVSLTCSVRGSTDISISVLPVDSAGATVGGELVSGDYTPVIGDFTVFNLVAIVSEYTLAKVEVRNKNAVTNNNFDIKYLKCDISQNNDF